MIFSLIQSECYGPMFAAGLLRTMVHWPIAEGTTTVTMSQLHGNIGLVQQSTDRPWCRTAAVVNGNWTMTT